MSHSASRQNTIIVKISSAFERVNIVDVADAADDAICRRNFFVEFFVGDVGHNNNSSGETVLSSQVYLNRLTEYLSLGLNFQGMI